MIKETIEKIRKKVEYLHQEIERIELDEDGASVYIKIKESDHIDGDFFLVGEEGTILDSLLDIKNNGIEDLEKEIAEIEDFWKAEEETMEDTNRYLRAQGWF